MHKPEKSKVALFNDVTHRAVPKEVTEHLQLNQLGAKFQLK